MKTLAAECDTLIEAIRVFEVTLLKVVRIQFLTVCKILNTMIEILEWREKRNDI